VTSVEKLKSVLKHRQAAQKMERESESEKVKHILGIHCKIPQSLNASLQESQTTCNSNYSLLSSKNLHTKRRIA
jgi:hypothetical protein